MARVGRYLRSNVLGIFAAHAVRGVGVGAYITLPSLTLTLNENRKTRASTNPHQHTELVVIWVHPPGGPGWGGARDLDFLIKESIMRIRNRPSDNRMMLLRRRKQNERHLGVTRNVTQPRCSREGFASSMFPFPLLLRRSWSNPDVHRQNSRESRRAVPALISRRGRA